MTKRSPYIEHAWRCCAIGCADFLVLRREDLNDPPDPEQRAMYLTVHGGNGARSWRDRLRCAWRTLRYGQDDWYEFSIEEPHVARQMAEALLLGADALAREQETA